MYPSRQLDSSIIVSSSTIFNNINLDINVSNNVVTNIWATCIYCIPDNNTDSIKLDDGIEF
jgi:hypothetical protein